MSKKIKIKIEWCKRNPILRLICKGNAWNTLQPPKPFQPTSTSLCTSVFMASSSSVFIQLFQAFNKTPQNDCRWAGGKEQIFLVLSFPFHIFFFTVFNLSKIFLSFTVNLWVSNQPDDDFVIMFLISVQLSLITSGSVKNFLISVHTATACKSSFSFPVEGCGFPPGT